MTRTNENPGALASAAGADLEATNFTKAGYTAVALRVHHLCNRLPVTPDQAAMLAALAFGEVRT